MPSLPKRICRKPGCNELTQGSRYCSEHMYMATIDKGVKRASATQRGYNSRWRTVSKMYLREHPLCECEECVKARKHTTANVVHHVIEHHGNYELFWDQDNWQAMNKKCHDRHTLMEMRKTANRGRKAHGM